MYLFIYPFAFISWKRTSQQREIEREERYEFEQTIAEL